MSGKQKTLFQTWGTSHPPDTRKPKDVKARKGKSSKPCGGGQALTRGAPLKPLFKHPPSYQEDKEEDDDVLLVAVYEAEKSLYQTVGAKPADLSQGQVEAAKRQPWDEQTETCSAPSKHSVISKLPEHHGVSNTINNISTKPGNPEHPHIPVQDNTAEKNYNSKSENIENLPGFDLLAGDVWIYPTNFPVRDYQFNITHTALLHNTLVCLPTGLGKTFIAAVVMYNFYRWYPSGKIVFMAPTKPLVAQQIEACFKVMGIPQGHMAEMTGSIQAQNRKEMWGRHRVFFLTPQIMVNDLTRSACPASEIKCLVIDEAHKSLGNHAYCQVVRELSNYTKQFRILALSATPGGDTKSVQQVVSNLLISQIELRSEDSPDIQPYSHERQLEKIVVPLGNELEAVQKTYLRVLETFAGRLIQQNVLSRRDIPNLTKYQIILSRDQFRKNPPTNIIRAQQGVIEGDYALCISLYHGYELLLQMGTRSLYIYLQGIMNGSKGMTRARNELSRNTDFMELFQQLEEMFSNTNVLEGNGSLLLETKTDSKKPFVYSHPKLKKLEEVVIQHFMSWSKNGDQSTSIQTAEDTRIMIFSSFRDSVQEIAEMLNQHQHIVRVMTFVGHSSTGKGVKGFTQKEQLEVVKRFREGGFNTLVSTCVGEEGLDIGEVDLIICFDAQKSPIRLVQRMGRTGRKRQGRIVVILCQGREERTYNQSQTNKRSIYKAVLGNNKVLHLNPQSPRMVPQGLNPRVHKMYITQGSYETKESIRSILKDRKSTTKKRKSSLLPKAAGTTKEDWDLTHGEFEAWNRLYRLQESDEIMNVRLPKAQFEYFRDEEESSEIPSENVRELSLTEWRVWQNRPFPEEFVEHSDRCKNFINIMETIEKMRMEEVSFFFFFFGRHELHTQDMDHKHICTLKEVLSKSSGTKDHEINDQWDELFDCENEENSLSVSEKSDTENLNAANEKSNLNSVASFLEDSFDLFEDDAISEIDNKEQVEFGDKNRANLSDEPKTNVTFNMFDVSLLLQDQSESQEEPETKDVLEQANVEEGLDCSEELFSVNFDLGFSIEDDELSESGSCESGNRREETISMNVQMPEPILSNVMNVVQCKTFSTPVMSEKGLKKLSKASGNQINLFSPLEPVKDIFAMKPAKSLYSSLFMTSLDEKCKSPETHFETLDKSESGESEALKARENKMNSTTIATHNDSSVIREDIKSQNTSPKRKLTGSSPESEDEVVFQRKRKLTKTNVFMSPQAASSDCDFDSPIPAAKKRKRVFDTPGSCDEDQSDFITSPFTAQTKAANHSSKSDASSIGQRKRKRSKLAARRFLDDEADLSSEGAEFVSSDEEVDSDNAQDTSLAEFLNDNTELSQELNDSEMHGVYLKSVQSPFAGSRFRMVPRRKNNLSVFSQIPEQDESYMEDSFCVQEDGDDEEANNEGCSEDEVEMNFDLLHQDSFVGGRKQYCTRRRLKLKGEKHKQNIEVRPLKKKTRLIIQDDSSEEEMGATSVLKVTTPPHTTKLASSHATSSLFRDPFCQIKGPSILIKNTYDKPLRDRCQERINLKATLSEDIDFQPESSCIGVNKSIGLSLISNSKGEIHDRELTFDSSVDSSAICNPSFTKAKSSATINTAPCILVDSREIASGSEVISYLKAALGLKVEVCSLGGCDYIVSNRLAVERKSQSEFSNSVNKSKLVERIQHLHSLFERVCLIIENDRVKPGETSRILQRTKYYDSTLSALISARVQILFSSSQEETAGLLRDLVLLEQRKSTGINVPTELKGHKLEEMQFYLSIPNVSYITALNLCHHFETVRQMANSSVNVISEHAHVSVQKAEEIYRYLHYVFEKEMIL
ncbi:hypothetical protein GDO86_015998 [Hymenochirus boettgeri]|uniref:ATP-dependent RNA helicase FANCM n=1 Tax=Hymenochirus boettgeri TaxID=247094 RepID=A0A8T2K054_9PIPI|nr:hypothetical protein GDO86_015998 [Hymenochirus boettgeri]